MEKKIFTKILILKISLKEDSYFPRVNRLYRWLNSYLIGLLMIDLIMMPLSLVVLIFDKFVGEWEQLWEAEGFCDK